MNKITFPWNRRAMTYGRSKIIALSLLPAIVAGPIMLWPQGANAESDTLPANPPAPATEQATAPTTILFYCKAVQDPASGTKIPATVVWVPGRSGNVRLVGWKSEYFLKAGFDPQKRCESVTPKFQKAYELGQLTYLRTGYLGGYPVVCGVKTETEVCNQANQLFTLKPHDNPDEVLQRLADILDGKASDMLLQSSTGQILIRVGDLASRGPLVDKDVPQTIPGAPYATDNGLPTISPQPEAAPLSPSLAVPAP